MKTTFEKNRLALTAFVIASSLGIGSVTAQDIPAAENTTAQPAAEQVETSATQGNLQFNFSGANWRDVLTWIADQSDLALQFDQTPAGTFSYSDPTRAYSIPEGLDVVNLALMKRGYTLVRRGRVLELIDLEVENADKLISEIAELVKPEDLESRGKSDIVSSVFPLGSMTPDQAKEELNLMKGPWGRVMVLDSARQVKVTETASKLIAIRDTLKNAAAASANVIEIVLKHRSADELLELARPLLEIEPGENSGDDIRISVGLYGDRIYATGLPGKTGLLEALIQKADQPLHVPDSNNTEIQLPEFRSHAVANADINVVFDVLQTMLEDAPDARVAVEPTTNSIIARVRPETHKLIENTIAQMEGRGRGFKVIELARLEPAQAILTINKFFGITEGAEGDGPVVDADPLTAKLWIRGTEEQIQQAEQLIQSLEGADTLSGLGEKVRVLPFSGRAAEDALMQAQDLWQMIGRPNQIRTLSPSRSSERGIPERRILREPDARTRPNTKPEITPKPPTSIDVRNNHKTRNRMQGEHILVVDRDDQKMQSSSSSSQTFNLNGNDIVVQMTPAGMIIASEDIDALDQFQNLIESVAGPASNQSDLPTIIWLKYIKSDVAAELVAKVLGGSDSVASSAVDSMLGGGLAGGMMGMLGLGGGGGGGSETSSAKSILTSTGSVNIVPDARLNALIIQANSVDMQMIELILAKIDIQESPEDIETVAKPALIPVIYQSAADVAEVVKSVFGDRIEGAKSNSNGGRNGGGGGQPSPQDFINAIRGGRGGGGGGGGGANAATSEPTKISIAVDSKSNSLVVRATPQDFEEVRGLVETLDYSSQPNEDTIVTYTPDGSLNPEVLRAALESILGTETKSTSDSSSSNTSSSRTEGGAGGSQTQSASEIQRRIDAFRSLRGGGGGPGGGAGRGGGPGGGGRGGGARGGGGGGRR